MITIPLCQSPLRHEGKPRRTAASNAHPAYLNMPPRSLDIADFLIGNPGIQGSNMVVRLRVLLEAGMFDESLPGCPGCATAPPRNQRSATLPAGHTSVFQLPGLPPGPGGWTGSSESARWPSTSISRPSGRDSAAVAERMPLPRMPHGPIRWLLRPGCPRPPWKRPVGR